MGNESEKNKLRKEYKKQQKRNRKQQQKKKQGKVPAKWEELRSMYFPSIYG